MATEIYICVSRTDGSVVHVAVQTFMRTPVDPGPPWRQVSGGWERDPADANIVLELNRFNQSWANRRNAAGNPDPDPTMVSWRRLSNLEHDMFNKDREYRNAMEDAGGKLQHNMPKARELHRAVLRHKNGDVFMRLDREWVDASASGKKAEADAVEAKRKMLRDFVNDPRIDAATTIDELKAVVPPEV